MSAVFRRELKAFFCRVSSYIFLGLFLCLVGLFMFLYNFYYGNTGFEYPLSMLCVSLALLLPLIVSPLFVQERASKTDRFLGMLPISCTDIVMGKYLSTASLLGILTVGMGIFPIILNTYSKVYFPTSVAGLLAFFLIGLAFLSLDCFLALMIRSRTWLFVVMYAIPVGLIGIGYLAQSLPYSVAKALEYISVFGAYTPFGAGLFDFCSLGIWISISAVFVVLTIRFSHRIRRA